MEFYIMILVKLTGDSITRYFVNQGESTQGGYIYNSNHHVPEITATSDPNFNVQNGFFSITGGYLTFRSGDINDFTSSELSAEIWIWDEHSDTIPIKVLDGKIFFTDEISKDIDKQEILSYKWKIRTDLSELNTNLLSSAHDLMNSNDEYLLNAGIGSGVTAIVVTKTILTSYPDGSTVPTSGVLAIDGDFYNYTSYTGSTFTLEGTGTTTSYSANDSVYLYNKGRVMPLNFGVVKYVSSFALFLTCTTGCGGVYSSDGKTLATYDEGIDVNYTQGASATHIVYNPTSGQAPVYNAYQDIDASATTSASVATIPDVVPAQPTQIVNSVGAAPATSSATRLTINGAYISDQTGVGTATRLDYEVTEDGQTHWYAYNTTSNQWDEIAIIGISSVGGDSIILQIDNHGEQFIPLYAKSSSNTLTAASIFSDGVGNTAIEILATGNSATTIGAGIRSRYGTALIVGDAADSGFPLLISGNSTKGHGLLSTGITSDPSSPVEGQWYYNSSTKKLRLYNGSAWTDLN
jgi:hypothetical protein